MKTNNKRKMAAKSPKKLTCIDLFAGCGGLSLGLEEAGFQPLLVSELSKDAMATYMANRQGQGIKQEFDIHKLTNAKLGRYMDEWNKDIDLVCGGPPCQGYSGIGHRRSFDIQKEDIPSNRLYLQMIRVIKKVKPKAFLFENVKGLMSGRWTKGGRKGEIWDDVRTAFMGIKGYVARPTLVQAKHYGVPQNRPRVIIIGIREDLASCPDRDCPADAVAAGLLPARNGAVAPDLIDLLGDLIDPRYGEKKATEKYHKAPANDVQKQLRSKDGKLMLKKGDPLTQQEYSNHKDEIREKFQWMIDKQEWRREELPKKWRTKKFAQRLLRSKWDDEPNITATSLPDDYVHFSQPRILTVREWARLQTFPDWYEFCGPRTTGGRRRAGDPDAGVWDRDVPRYTQIGNAVPVLLAKKIGEHLLGLL
ncbi:MAG: DNA cytosine methyltransferase [Verrucomicrobiota bacterium]|jgi:DNA (cytosine-5)-methyltransferase 1|nr:DNA cytosine methyltransferase [Verrucomicrobiota bacterium]